MRPFQRTEHPVSSLSRKKPANATLEAVSKLSTMVSVIAPGNEGDVSRLSMSLVIDAVLKRGGCITFSASQKTLEVFGESKMSRGSPGS
jgi:hypothetical protein